MLVFYDSLNEKSGCWNTTVFSSCFSFSLLLTAQKIKFSFKDFFSKCDQIRGFLQIWSHLLNKYLVENFIFCAVYPYESCTHLDEPVVIDIPTSNLKTFSKTL